LSIKRVIILGGSGFLGSYIANILSTKKGIEPSYSDLTPNPNLAIDYLPLNILDLSSMKSFANYEVIINCIGQATNPFNLCYSLNTKGINNLIKSLGSDSSRFIQISTTAVYGSGKYCNEFSPLNPETNYATAKAVAEFQLEAELDATRLTILRLSNLYGPGQKKGVVAYLLRSNLSDKLLQFNNDGNLIRRFLHVQDAARVISECVINSKIKGVYNVKGPDCYSLRELINAFEKKFNMNFEKEFSNSPTWENIENLDDSRLYDIIDFRYEHNILSYFKNMVTGH